MKKERIWMRVEYGEWFKCTGMHGCNADAISVLADKCGQCFAAACCHSHLWGDYRHWKTPFAVVDMKDRPTFFASDGIEDFT